jgi:hypothetical protein
VLNNIDRIKPEVSKGEIYDFMRFPFKFKEVIRFKSKRLMNFALWLISRLPPIILAFSVWGLGKIKKLL